MRKIILLALLTGCALGQSLPSAWVDPNEWLDGTYILPAYEMTFPNAWVIGPPPSCTFHLPYSVNLTGLQSAIIDVEACRTLTTVGTIIDIPPGLYTGTFGPYLPQSSNVPAVSFNVLRSTQDANLPLGRTVCSHGIQDNLPTSTDIGLINADCAGDNLAYQLGTAITSLSGSFTLANGTATTASAYNDVQYMWTAEATGGAAFRACAPVGGGSLSSNTPACTSTVRAPDAWIIEDMEARPQVGITVDNNIIQMFGSGSETSASQYPQHIHFRKDWAHAGWTTIAAGLNSVNNAFEISCGYCSVVDSQTSQNLRPGNEGHSILAQGAGPYRISHDWLEGQSSGIFAGGGVPAVFGLIPFQDVEVRRNRLTFPYSWLGLMTISGNAHWNGQSIVRKNCEEFKAGQRILFDGDICENSDNSGGQGGILMNQNVRNASVSGFGSYYQSIISDVTFSNNILRNSCEGFGLDRSSGLGNGNGVSNMFYRGLFLNNLLYNVSTTNPGCAGVNHTGILWQNSQGHFWQGTVTENALGTAATFVATCAVDTGGCLGQIASIAVGTLGTGCSGNGTLAVSAPNIAGGFQAAGTYTCSAGALATVTITNPSGYPTSQGSGYSSPPTMTPATGTGTVTVTMVSSPVTPPLGFQVLDLNAGDPAAITMCPTSALNNVTTAVYGGKTRPNQVGPLASTGSLPWNGTPSAGNLTVIYPWTATANLADTSGYCTLTNIQGGPRDIHYQHNTFDTDSTASLTSNNAPLTGGNFQVGAEIRDSIFLGGGWNNVSFGEGNPSINNNYDTTSLTADHVVWPTRNAAIYTAYGNNPAFPVVSPVMYFPATPAAVGFSCSGCGSSVPLVLTDYHGFALALTSPYHNTASDGTDIGPAIVAIDAAQSLNLYICLTTCGSPGPFPDVFVPIVPTSGTVVTGGSSISSGTVIR